MISAQKCSSKNNNVCSKPHRKDELLVMDRYYKDKSDPSKGTWKTCDECREYDKIREEDRINEIIRKWEEIGDDNFFYCTVKKHRKLSYYPAERVPQILFRKDPNNPKSKKVKMCFDCRQGAKVQTQALIQLRKSNVTEGMSVYERCAGTFPTDTFYIRQDGNRYTTCKKCTDNRSKLYEIELQERVKLINKIKMEISIKNGGCCERCKYIFLKSDNGEPPLTILEHYYNKRTGWNYVWYENNWYESTSFINDNEYRIAFYAMEFDHLTMEEQLDKGIISCKEEYEPKKNGVYSCKLTEIPNEIRKCQLLCQYCHLEKTIEREKSTAHLGINSREKLVYVNNFKLQGCCLCGYKNPNMLRFFDCDHLGFYPKIANISIMVTFYGYTILDVMNECSKCRVLCKCCHVACTMNQRENGLFDWYRKFIVVQDE